MTSAYDEERSPVPPKLSAKIILLGNGGVGKTSLIQRFIRNRFSAHYKATIGADFLTKTLSVCPSEAVPIAPGSSSPTAGSPFSPSKGVFAFAAPSDDKSVLVNLQIWDTAGLERFDGLGTHFYRGTDVYLLVFDLSNAASFEKIPQWRDHFLRAAAVHDASAPQIPFFIVGTKLDVADAPSGGRYGGREVKTKTVRDWCETQVANPPYYETSAATGAGIAELFEDVARHAVAQQRRCETQQWSTSQVGGGLDPVRPRRNTGCC